MTNSPASDPVNGRPVAQRPPARQIILTDGLSSTRSGTGRSTCVTPFFVPLDDQERCLLPVRRDGIPGQSRRAPHRRARPHSLRHHAGPRSTTTVLWSELEAIGSRPRRPAGSGAPVGVLGLIYLARSGARGRHRDVGKLGGIARSCVSPLTLRRRGQGEGACLHWSGSCLGERANVEVFSPNRDSPVAEAEIAVTPPEIKIFPYPSQSWCPPVPSTGCRFQCPPRSRRTGR